VISHEKRQGVSLRLLDQIRPPDEQDPGDEKHNWKGNSSYTKTEVVVQCPHEESDTLYAGYYAEEHEKLSNRLHVVLLVDTATILAYQGFLDLTGPLSSLKLAGTSQTDPLSKKRPLSQSET
jgi:hypothetical protein